jgi:D-arginine dehydrogenase
VAGWDVVIVGAGVAGASLAYALARRGVGRVLVLEREGAPAHHASGRSAGVLNELSLDPVIHRMLSDGAAFLRSPPEGFPAVFSPTGVLSLFDEPDWSRLVAAVPGLRAHGTALELLTPDEAAALAPVVRAEDLTGAVWQPADGRLDVPALVDAYLAHAPGVERRFGVTARALDRRGDRCVGVITDEGPLAADWVVDAAGPWAGALGRAAGATTIPLVPRSRTVISFDPPPGLSVARWPLISFESRGLYVGPEGPGLLASPMDEDDREPCDAVPDPARIELALARLRALLPALAPARPRAARAGLRTFAPDRRLVIGEDPRLARYFWLAGQGGWGIETSPCAARIAADLIVSGATDWPDAAALSPARFC